MPPERAVERALAGCEEKAREFRRMATRTIPERGRAKFLSKVDGEMKQYALVVARAAAAVPP